MSRLLRPESVPAAAAGFNLRDLEREGREILRRAREQAEALVRLAERRASQLADDARREGLESGRAEGHAAGLKEGREQGRAEGLAECRQATATVAAALDALVAEFGARREALVKQAEQDLLRLAVAVAARIVRREVKADPGGAARRAVVEAVSLAAERSRVSVRVNPADLAVLGEAQAELAGRFADLGGLEILGEESVERGGCRVLTPGGEVDMQIGTQLDRIERLLAGEPDNGDEPGGQPAGEAAP